MCAKAIIKGSKNGKRMVDESNLMKYLKKMDWPTYKGLIWYHQVHPFSSLEEGAGIGSTRRPYLKLWSATSSRPKAEFVFKLVSEGYVCLSDNVKRREFDLDRKKFYPIATQSLIEISALLET
ncbi:unnamed protein product [Citrullus colocynthis]|uniref:Uncharacterized protein n=1 Tax=Citrullus colocynthis TaxID=252529 RepID=A0ABP0Y5W0_9ROSI